MAYSLKLIAFSFYIFFHFILSLFSFFLLYYVLQLFELINPYNERNKHKWDYYISFANAIPSYELKNQLWPPKGAIQVYYLEQKPLIAIMQNKIDTIPQDTLTEPTPTIQKTAFN